MQKVIRRTQLAEKQAVRRLTKRKDKIHRDETKTNREQNSYRRKDAISGLKQARLNRREDWELGPLKPNREVGDKMDSYGTVSQQLLRGPIFLHAEERDEVLNIWGGKFLNLVKGDRVVLLEGRDKGKIGAVASIDTKRAECTVQGLNMVDVTIPKYMISAEDQDKRPFRSVEQAVSLRSIKLVFPLPDPETGIVRDVIVRKLANTKIWHDKAGHCHWTRMIPGIDVKVPWPKKEEKEKPEYPIDTIRVDVDIQTFVPTLLRPPMPGSVIDELRNKYSIFRTRHDPEYIEAKMQEDEEVIAKKKMVEQMRTPLKEANRKKRKERKAKGKPRMSRETLERIGRVIANKRQLAADAVIGSTVTVTPMMA